MATGIAGPEVQLLNSEVIRQISTDQSQNTLSGYNEDV